MEHYDELKELLHAELKRIEQTGELTTTSLDHADKLAHCLKSILTIEAMEDAGERHRRYDDGYESRSRRGMTDRYRDDYRR